MLSLSIISILEVFIFHIKELLFLNILIIFFSGQNWNAFACISIESLWLVRERDTNSSGWRLQIHVDK